MIVKIHLIIVILHYPFAVVKRAFLFGETAGKKQGQNNQYNISKLFHLPSIIDLRVRPEDDKVNTAFRQAAAPQGLPPESQFDFEGPESDSLLQFPQSRLYR